MAEKTKTLAAQTIIWKIKMRMLKQLAMGRIVDTLIVRTI